MKNALLAHQNVHPKIDGNEQHVKIAIGKKKKEKKKKKIHKKNILQI